MSRRLIRIVLAAWLCAAALTACSSDDDPPTAATVPTAPPVTPTTDASAIPAVIDEAYVNRVLAGLDAAVGDVVRMVVREKGIPYEAAERLQAIYIDKKAWQLTIDLLQEDSFERFSSYRTDPGNLTTVVSSLIVESKDCIFAEVSRDYTAVGINQVALRTVSREAESKSYNPTRWGYVYDGFTPNRSRPADPCAKR